MKAFNESESRANITALRSLPERRMSQPFQLAKGAIEEHRDEDKGVEKKPPNNPTYEELDSIEQAHKKLAREIFPDHDSDASSNEGFKIFQQYNTHTDNILTKLSFGDNSIFDAILGYMRWLVKGADKVELLYTVPVIARDFLEHLIIHHHTLLAQVNDDGVRSLDMAAAKLKPVVLLVADLVLDDDKLYELPVEACPTKRRTPHPDACHVELPRSLRYAFARGPSAPDSAASTPCGCVHETVRVDELRQWNMGLKDTVKDVLLPQKTNSLHPPSIMHILLEEDGFTGHEFDNKAESFHRLIKLCSDDTLTLQDAEGRLPLHKAILLYERDGIDFALLHLVIRSLVEKCPSSIYIMGKSLDGATLQTPYSMLKEVRPGQKNREKEKSWDKTVTLLKNQCIGSEKDRDDKLRYLYGNIKDARKIHLDMAFPNVINKDFVAGLSETVQFRLDTTLEYVSLRRDLPASYPLIPPVRDNTSQERNPYQSVFSWLQNDCHVEKIFSIIIEDLVPYPHSDAAIKTALKPFKVEKWDWRKLDISSQTILEAAPETRILNLQSSGNEAVLQSWACKSGLAQLKQLDSITVTMHSDLRETRKDCKKYFDNFKEKFCRRRPGMRQRIFLNWAVDESSSNDAGDAALSSGHYSAHSQHAWIKTMSPFIDFINTTIRNRIEEDDMIEKQTGVAIALIDDGVLSTAKDIPYIENGKSFYGERDNKIRFRDYYTGPSHNGTRMAQCIYKVCPMVQLYVARVDDSMPQLDKFTMDSATKAVIWATDMDVDIISMSWSFSEQDGTRKQLEDFRAALKKAASNGILLLGSLNDEEAAVPSECYPSALEEVISVGSATKWGDRARTTKGGFANYLLPGEDIPLPDDKIASGSPLATAFASGLGGLIVYMSRALRRLYGANLSEGDHDNLRKVATRESMKRVFNMLGGSPNTTAATDLFVDPGLYFPKDPERVADEEGKPEVLRKFFLGLQVLKQ
ncbi:hypothetical protein GGR52DRAFT_527302 [Hypoxylon sp. FL1284]|nr:hypothetical protein GGR52DRAFT_527302 [Hypoxylon sp. FL1284]